MQQKITLFICASFILMFEALAQDVGINTFVPEYTLDVRGQSDKDTGADLQISTPSMTNFLRFFSGRTADRNPFLAFHDLDTLHFVTTPLIFQITHGE